MKTQNCKYGFVIIINTYGHLLNRDRKDTGLQYKDLQDLTVID